MSFLKDVLGFESFNLKDMAKKVAKHPDQLLTGVDPISTKAWNGVLGRKYEPVVDQMGGAYGGHMFSAFGNKDGGVYKRAEDAGINTGPGGGMQDAAHVIAALMTANYFAGKMPQGQSEYSQYSKYGQQPQQQYQPTEQKQIQPAQQFPIMPPQPQPMQSPNFLGVVDRNKNVGNGLFSASEMYRRRI